MNTIDYLIFDYFNRKHSKLNKKELINKLYIEKNTKINYDIFFDEHVLRDRLDLIKDLFHINSKRILEFRSYMLKELKQNYIKEHGIENYLRNEKYILINIKNKITKKQKYLLDFEINMLNEININIIRKQQIYLFEWNN